jgi:hypothetical protein
MRKNKHNAKAPENNTPTFKGGKCQKCGCYRYSTNKCNTPCHLVVLYQQSMGKSKKVEGPGSEAYLTGPSTTKFEAGCSSKCPQEPSTNEPALKTDDHMDTVNTIVKFSSNDMFGDFI